MAIRKPILSTAILPGKFRVPEIGSPAIASLHIPQHDRLLELFQIGLVLKKGNTFAKLVDFLLLGERINAL